MSHLNGFAQPMMDLRSRLGEGSILIVREKRNMIVLEGKQRQNRQMPGDHHE